MVTFHTNHGDIVIKTFDDKAPETVKNFLDYCREGFYNNTIFHRVINGFMIQGGGFEPGMKQKATKEAIKNEANNGLKNTRGTLAMARTQAPHSATAQFFHQRGRQRLPELLRRKFAGLGLLRLCGSRRRYGRGR